MDHPVISADGHIDLPLLPPDLFTAGAPAALRDRMPHVIERDGVVMWVDEKGTELAKVGGVGHTGIPYARGDSRRLDRMNESGFWDDCARGVYHPTDPELRIQAQERDGIVGEVLYGILGLANRFDDPELLAAVLRIYNDFLADFVASKPGRYAGIGCLPAAAPDALAAELRRCAELGLQGVELALTHDLLPLWRRDFDPLWEAAHETGVPVHLHTIGPPIDLAHVTSHRDRMSWMGSWLTVFQLGMATRMSELIFGGAPHRYPNLRVVLGESGIGWLPYILDRMDLEWEERLTHLELDMPPSGYWRRQMAATFQLDEAGLLLADRIGVDNLMWGNDFPHGDGVWPDSIEHIERQFAQVSADTRRAITYTNAAKLYGFPLED